MSITITVNGKRETIQKNTRVSDFLATKKLDPDRIVVEYNLDILDRDSIETCTLKEQDSLEILRIVGGG